MKTMRRGLVVWLALALAWGVVGCGEDAGTDAPAPVDDNNGGGKEDSNTDEQNLCVAVRGNGQLIFAHFGGMARIHEQYGPISAVSGGSSGSITAFLTESAYANAHIHQCGEKACTDEEKAARVALIFKSLEGYMALLSQSEEVQAIQALIPLAQRAQAEGIGALVENGDIEGARAALLNLLQSDDLKALINQEVIELLTNSPNPEFHVQDLWSMISSFGSFAVDSDRIFVRPGLVDFNAFAEKIGRIGSFYAAYGPANAAAWEAFMSGCAEPMRGLNWRELQGKDAGDGLTCGQHYEALLTTWREAWLADEANQRSRIDDPMGTYLSVAVSTSVLQGAAVDTFKQARADYADAKDYTFDISFDDVYFGYWGNNDDLSRIGSNPQGFEDAKTKKFLSLGQATWRESLSLSPAEPGLTRALEINESQVSAGGWSDLAPSLVLKNLGCDNVALVTRQGSERGFATSVATLLGMTPEQDAALYDLTDASSGVFTSLENSDGNWCTDWNNVSAFDFGTVFDDAYNAPLETEDPFFTDSAYAYENISSKLGLPGCTPGTPAE